MKKMLLLIVACLLMNSTYLGGEIVLANTAINANECDLDQNGKTDTYDALIILKFSAKLMSPTYEQLAYGDLNCDCKITADDALTLLKLLVKLINEVPNSAEYTTINEKKYADEELDYIISILESGADIQDEAIISKIAIGDVYEGGKPELVLIDTNKLNKTYIYSEVDGKIKVDICETAIRYNVAYLGNDFFDIYGNIFTYDISQNPIDLIEMIYR